MKTDQNMNIPKNGLAGLKENFTNDALSGLLVFLLALPLSLGIAKASDFPAIFGLVTAIIGGIVVSFFAGSRLTIKGPAAGLIVIASEGVAAFGGGDAGWHLILGAIVVAGVIQIVFGILKFGKLADFFPGAAIHGMLAAIGIIIMSKQIHTLLGVIPKLLNGKNPLELLAMIPNSIMHENDHITEIGVACLILLILLSFIKHERIKKIPAPLVVLAISIPLGLVLNIKTDNEIANYSLVKIGNIFEAFTPGAKIGDFVSSGFFNVDFSGLTSNMSEFVKYVILFALIGSLESLLTAKAIDHLDPHKLKSDFNKDLRAVGIGNTLAGLLGGLPMISEVARSSANVSNGAKTRWANFFHGVFLLLAVLLFVPIIEMIPNAALASMLIFVGFRLAHPREFKHMWHVGKEQFIIFTTTVIVTLATDLLIGVGSGIVSELIVNIFNSSSVKGLFSSKIEISNHENNYKVKINSGLMFSNILSFKKELATIPLDKHVHADFSKTSIIDHTSMIALRGITEDFKKAGGSFKIDGLHGHRHLGHDQASTRLLK